MKTLTELRDKLGHPEYVQIETAREAYDHCLAMVNVLVKYGAIIDRDVLLAKINEWRKNDQTKLDYQSPPVPGFERHKLRGRLDVYNHLSSVLKDGALLRATQEKGCPFDESVQAPAKPAAPAKEDTSLLREIVATLTHWHDRCGTLPDPFRTQDTIDSRKSTLRDVIQHINGELQKITLVGRGSAPSHLTDAIKQIRLEITTSERAAEESSTADKCQRHVCEAVGLRRALGILEDAQDTATLAGPHPGQSQSAVAQIENAAYDNSLLVDLVHTIIKRGGYGSDASWRGLVDTAVVVRDELKKHLK